MPKCLTRRTQLIRTTHPKTTSDSPYSRAERETVEDFHVAAGPFTANDGADFMVDFPPSLTVSIHKSGANFEKSGGSSFARNGRGPDTGRDRASC